MIASSEYVLVTDNPNLPLSTDDVNNHLKESFADITTDTWMTIFIKAVEKFGEQFTRRVFLSKTFDNYRSGWNFTYNQFYDLYEIRKSRLISIDSVKYIDIDDVEQTIDSSEYSFTLSEEYSNLYFFDSFNLPSLSCSNPQPIIIRLKAGFGDTYESVPDIYKMAMLNHLAKLWQNRGDCPSDANKVDNWMVAMMPEATAMVYSLERIQDILI